jgi:hypothetical protein
VDGLDALEQLLLRLGRQELQLEVQMEELLRACRAAGAGGDARRADSLWALYEDARSALLLLKSEIQAVEAKLYGLRRRQRNS